MYKCSEGKTLTRFGNPSEAGFINFYITLLGVSYSFCHMKKSEKKEENEELKKMLYYTCVKYLTNS